MVETPLLDKFKAIKLIDSSGWNISPGLKKIFPGSGGSASPAGCKVQLVYEYKTGAMHSVEITKGTLPDQKYSQEIPGIVNENDLIIFDLGYWVSEIFMKIKEKGAYFISRLNTRLNLLIKEGNDKFSELNLENFLKNQNVASIEFSAF